MTHRHHDRARLAIVVVTLTTLIAAHAAAQAPPSDPIAADEFRSCGADGCVIATTTTSPEPGRQSFAPTAWQRTRSVSMHRSEARLIRPLIAARGAVSRVASCITTRPRIGTRREARRGAWRTIERRRTITRTRGR